MSYEITASGFLGFELARTFKSQDFARFVLQTPLGGNNFDQVGSLTIFLPENRPVHFLVIFKSKIFESLVRPRIIKEVHNFFSTIKGDVESAFTMEVVSEEDGFISSDTNHHFDGSIGKHT